MSEQADSPQTPPAPAPDSTAAPPPPAAPPVARSIGERLRAGRERAGLSVPASAEKLHLDPRVIEALEADRFAEVGASVYVRGHLRRYGDFVGENGAELVSMYSTRESRVSVPDLTRVPHPERRADPRRLVTPLAVLGSAAVLAVAIWWVLAGSRPAQTGSVATPVAAELPGALPVSAGANDTAATLSDAATAVPSSTAPSAALAAAPGHAAATPVAVPTSPAAAPAATTPAPDTAPMRETRLRLELTNDSWVEVYDARGDRLFYDVASAGSVQSFSGRGPLRVFLGSAAGVTVEVDGQVREIPANAADGEGARFVVNRSGSLSRAR